MNRDENNRKLIWQNYSPLPYESAWSVISKIILLNSLSPVMLVSLLYQKKQSPKPTTLDHRDSSWIDFEKYSNLLGVEQSRLKQGFLTEIGFEKKKFSSGAIKYCPLCSEKGFHSVFFDMDIIRICPWHQIPLKKCMECNKSITKKPLKKEIVQDGGYEWQIATSKCSHLYLDDRKIGKIHSMSDSEIEDICFKSELMAGWLLNLRSQSNLFDELNDAETLHSLRPEVTESIFSLAESVAGPCPWPIDYEAYSIRSVRWSEINNDQKLHTYEDNVKFSSEFGKTYKSIKNLLFNRYVRHHKRCWQCLTHYDLISAINLNADTICHVCLAFATWRMINEGRLEVSSFHKPPDMGRARLRVLKLQDNSLDQIQSDEETRMKVSIDKFSNVLYSQFFLIWRTLIVKKNLNIYHTGVVFNSESYFPLLKSKTAETIIYPSPEYCKTVSRQICKHMSRIDSFMLIPWASVSWFDERKERMALDNYMFFKISVEVENTLWRKKNHEWVSF